MEVSKKPKRKVEDNLQEDKEKEKLNKVAALNILSNKEASETILDKLARILYKKDKHGGQRKVRRNSNKEDYKRTNQKTRKNFRRKG